MASPGDPRCPRCGGSAGTSRFCPSCGLALSLLTPGQVLDEKYRILDKIGEGGMGEVYRARHVHLDAIRIIKVTKPDAAGGGPESRRFQEEARMASLVRHPNVAALYDFSRRPDGSFYMVWEFIEGVTLQEWMRRHGRVPLEQALDVAEQVLAGLGAIHGQGIVHRDISPDNIMVREVPGGRLQAKIIDLGIAKRVAAESLEMTGTGIFVGKLKYGSPEQAGSLSAGQTIDPRSDLYSFGVVLYEMLSGKAPFEAKTPTEYMGKHLHQTPPPLDLSGLPETVGPAVAAVVAKALEKKRERRFRDAREFGEALRAVSSPAAAAEAPTRANRTPPPESPWRPSPRRLGLSVVAVSILVAAGLGVWALAHRRGEKPRTAVLQRRSSKVAGTEARPTQKPTGEVPSPAIAAPAAIAPSPEAEAAPAPRATGESPGSGRGPATVPVETASAVAGEVTPLSSAPPPETEEDRWRQRIERWKAHPIQERARRAGEIARWANKFVSQHPDAPDAGQLKQELPALFKQETLDALDLKRPYLAMAFYRAYSSLDFAPPDAGLARRVNASVPLPRRAPQ